MICISLLLVAVGVVTASPAGFLQDTPDVQFAKAQFIAEYNRLARLAAEAPDIHIYTQSPISHVHNAIPVSVSHKPLSRHSLNALNDYSFSHNLGDNSQYIPSQYSHYQPVAAPVHTHHVAAPVYTHRQTAAPATYNVWTGPFADTVPAGVHGLPTQVTDTPAVKAAKVAHFRAVAAALRNTRPATSNQYY